MPLSLYFSCGSNEQPAGGVVSLQLAEFSFGPCSSDTRMQTGLQQLLICIQVRGVMSCLLINDIDAGLGHFANTQVCLHCRPCSLDCPSLSLMPVFWQAKSDHHGHAQCATTLPLRRMQLFVMMFGTCSSKQFVHWTTQVLPSSCIMLHQIAFKHQSCVMCHQLQSNSSVSLAFA